MDGLLSDKEQLHNKLSARHMSKPEQIYTGGETIRLCVRFCESSVDKNQQKDQQLSINNL